jgi:pimeloyl-ACP methyl ester carboxylesterase
MSWQRAAALFALVLTVAGCGGRTRVERDPSGAACMRLSSERQVRGETLCEDVFTCIRPPGGLVDRIGLRRLALCSGATGPVVLFLPGMHMNGEIGVTDARYDLRLYLAQAGIRAWSLDYRTHNVPAVASQDQLQALAGWSRSVFLQDADWAVRFVRGADPGPLYLAGFSYGAGLAYALASSGDQPIAGLIIIDGTPSGGRFPEGGGSAIDVAGSQINYADRARLLKAVIANPNGPSPVGGYSTAGQALADILYSSPAFGGQGGLSAARSNVSDVRVVAQLLDTYDRWWPGAASQGAATGGPHGRLPVLAFASGNMGPAWTEQVHSGAKQFGGDKATIIDLPLHGHIDLLVGRLAAEDVFEPTRRWLMGGR